MVDVEMKGESAADRVEPLRSIVDAWAQSELGQQAQAGFPDKITLRTCWARVSASEECVTRAEESFQEVLTT